MSISARRLTDGRTVYDVRLRAPNGRHYKRSFRTKKEAQDFAAKERVDQGQGTWVDPHEGKIRFSEYSTTWLRTRATIRPRTRDLYEIQLRLHILPTFGEFEIASITNAKVRAWHSALFDKGLAQSSCAKVYRMLRTILSTAVEDGLIVKNPCTIKGAAVARNPERPIATIEQVMALADAIDPRYRLTVLLGTFAGLRLGEVLALTRERIDFATATVVVTEQLQELANGEYLVSPPKTAAGRREVSVPSFMMEELAHHLIRFAEAGPCGRLFRGAEGGPLRRAVLHRAWDQARKQVGTEHLHFHDLRHTGNTLAAATGASTRELMARMGHASAEAALRYQHATRDRDAAIASRLNDMVTDAVEAGGSNRGAADIEQPGDKSNVTSLEAHRVARTKGTRRGARHERAMVEESNSGSTAVNAVDQDFDESGRRESNPRSQLGKLMFCR